VYICGMLGAINSRYSLRRELDDHNEQVGRVSELC
jgi:hypothetical protein